MRAMLFALALAVVPVGAASRDFFEVGAVFRPAHGDVPGGVAVTFTPRDPDVRLNERPAPRLALAEGQTVLVDEQEPPPPLEPIDPETVAYLDTEQPVVFPVSLRADAPRGRHVIEARVVYYFCSVRAGWCRRGSAEVLVPVNVP